MAPLAPDRLRRRGKRRVGERPDRDGDRLRLPFGLPEDGRAAIGTEMEGNRVTAVGGAFVPASAARSEEHTSELQSLKRISYAVLCSKKKNNTYKLLYP